MSEERGLSRGAQQALLNFLNKVYHLVLLITKAYIDQF